MMNEMMNEMILDEELCSAVNNKKPDYCRLLVSYKTKRPHPF